MRRHEIDQEAWERIEVFLPGKAGDPGVTAADNRLFISAVFWIAKTGAPWRGLTERFGQWNSVLQRFNRWSKNDVWEKITAVLGDDPDLEGLMIDSHGNPVRFVLTPGQSAGLSSAAELIDNLEFDALLADKGYDADWLVDSVEASHHAEEVIPPRKGRKHPREYDGHT